MIVNEIELYRRALREANDWLLAGEGVDLCYYIDDTKDKQIVRQLLDNIYSEPKQRLIMIDDYTKLKHEAAELRLQIYQLQKKNESMITCAMVIGSIMISYFIFT